jgi:hypothetical protein
MVIYALIAVAGALFDRFAVPAIVAKSAATVAKIKAKFSK